MNAERRKQIDKARALLEEAKEILEVCQSDEQDYFDSMPENMQGGDKGQAAEAAADALGEAVNSCDEALSNIDTATE